MSSDFIREEFEKRLKSGEFFQVRECSLCQNPIRLFSDGERLFCDINCGCTRMYRPPNPLDWNYLDFYFDDNKVMLNKIKEWLADESE